MSQQEVIKRSGLQLSEGVLLAIASSWAYLLAFYYEKGFASYFKIPIDFIGIGLVNILVLAALVIGGLLFLFPLMNLLIMFFPRNIHPVLSREFIPFGLIILLTIIQIYLYGMAGWIYWTVYLVMLIIIACVVFVLPLIFHRKKEGYVNKLEAQQQIDDGVSTLADQAAIRFGPNSLLIALILMLSINISENAGRAAALRQTEFMVTNTVPELVVLQIYGDNMICAPFDRNTKEIQRKFSIIKMASDSKLVLNLENIGPLHSMEKMANTTPMPTQSPSAVPTSTPLPESTSSPVVPSPSPISQKRD